MDLKRWSISFEITKVEIVLSGYGQNHFIGDKSQSHIQPYPISIIIFCPLTFVTLMLVNTDFKTCHLSRFNKDVKNFGGIIQLIGKVVNQN
jgi:hypothetical protein